MKKLLLLSICLFGFIKGQEIEIVDGDYTYTKVIEIPKSKSEIYKSLKTWLNNTASKSKYIIDQDDPETGIVSFNERLPEMNFIYLHTSQVSYKVNIEIKDNKIRYRVNNFIFNNSLSGFANYKKSYDFLLTTIEEESQKMKENLEFAEKEEKPRVKKKYEIEALNARNNLRSLNELKDAIYKQIVLNEQLISEKLTKNDDW